MVTLQLHGDTVHVGFPRENRDGCDRVKVRTPHSYLVLDEQNKRESGDASLALGETLHLDAYGYEGEGHLLSQNYRREETGLVLEGTDWNEDIEVVIDNGKDEVV